MTARRCSTCRHWNLHPWDSITPHCKNLCTLLSERQHAIDGGAVLTSVDHYCDDWEERKPLVYGESVTESIQRIVDELDAWPTDAPRESPSDAARKLITVSTDPETPGHWTATMRLRPIGCRVTEEPTIAEKLERVEEEGSEDE